MLPFRSYYGYEGRSNPTSVNLMDGDDSVTSSASKAERKSTETCKSHKEAERRRRQRINAHLSTLRTLLPNTTKTDKASLLAEVVHHVRELRKQVADVAAWREWDGCRSNTVLDPEQSTWPFPGESDEATVSYCDEGARLVKVTLCCEDRPGLNLALSRVIRSVRAKAIRAEMMTVGGRTKSVVVMKWAGDGDLEIEYLKRALNDVIENHSSSSGLDHVGQGKRARVYGSVNENDLDEFLVCPKMKASA